MKLKHCVYALALLMLAAQPTSAACVELLTGYLKDPHGATTFHGSALYDTQFALAKIVAVHTDNKPKGGWGETGTIYLIKIESNGKSLPALFSVPYQKRRGMVIGGTVILVDCETWDDIMPEVGQHLLLFVRPEAGGWEVPELPSSDIVFNADHLNPYLRKDIQPLFHTRL